MASVVTNNTYIQQVTRMKLTYTNVVVVERINETDNSIDLTPPGPTNGMI